MKPRKEYIENALNRAITIYRISFTIDNKTTIENEVPIDDYFIYLTNFYSSNK